MPPVAVAVQVTCDPAATGDERLGDMPVSESAGGSFKKVTHDRVAILPHECDGAVVKHGDDHGAAGVMDHVALVREFAFAHGVDGDVENASFENLLAVDRFGLFVMWSGHRVCSVSFRIKGRVSPSR